MAFENNKSRDIDYRARLQLYGKFAKTFFADNENVLSPLKVNRGIVFPYTPSIYISRNANYGDLQFKGANFPVYTFVNSSPPMIPIIAQFTCTSQEEAQYTLAVFRFLNIISQADFGERAVQQQIFGRPPPVLQFSYMGPFGFDRVPCVLTDFNTVIGNSVDMVPVEHPVMPLKEELPFVSAFGDKTVTYMPVEMELQINLVPQYSPRRVRKDFSLDDMRKGKNIGFI